MRQISTYLSFNGTAGDAMRFNEKTLGARLVRLIRYGNLPPSPQMPPGSADKALHAQLSFANGDVLMALTDGGHVLVPLQPSFFAKAFGMVIDRFGTPWMVSGGTVKA